LRIRRIGVLDILDDLRKTARVREVPELSLVQQRDHVVLKARLNGDNHAGGTGAQKLTVNGVRDTMKSVNEAEQLYILAADLVGPRPQSVPPRG
jgi:hypothetical protein